MEQPKTPEQMEFENFLRGAVETLRNLQEQVEAGTVDTVRGKQLLREYSETTITTLDQGKK